MAIGDLNGDGAPDLAVANFGSDSVSVLLGNGDGTLQTRQDSTTDDSPRSVAICDLNGDNAPDLAVANSDPSSNSVGVLLSNGDGTFQSRQDFTTGTQPFSVAIGDLNGGRAPDLAVANVSSDSVSVLLNQCDPAASCPGDTNGDGQVDFADLNFVLSNFGVPCPK